MRTMTIECFKISNKLSPTCLHTTQELEFFFFFCRTKREKKFQNLTLGYMTKTLNQIIFFSSTKIRIFFSATSGIRIFTSKLEKIQERALRFIYDDFVSSYDELLVKAKVPSLKIRRMRTMASN
jgi:hypothetical protein